MVPIGKIDLKVKDPEKIAGGNCRFKICKTINCGLKLNRMHPNFAAQNIFRLK